MKNVDELRAQKPNLWRVACELSKFKDPYKALDALVVLAGPLLKGGRRHDEQ